MFDTRQLEKINPQYFNIIMLSEHDVTVQSRNTRHYWYLHNTDYPKEGNCVIFHKHKASHPYHLYGRAECYRKQYEIYGKTISGRWMERLCNREKIVLSNSQNRIKQYKTTYNNIKY